MDPVVTVVEHSPLDERPILVFGNHFGPFLLASVAAQREPGDLSVIVQCQQTSRHGGARNESLIVTVTRCIDLPGRDVPLNSHVAAHSNAVHIRCDDRRLNFTVRAKPPVLVGRGFAGAIVGAQGSEVASRAIVAVIGTSLVCGVLDSLDARDNSIDRLNGGAGSGW